MVLLLWTVLWLLLLTSLLWLRLPGSVPTIDAGCHRQQAKRVWGLG